MKKLLSLLIGIIIMTSCHKKSNDQEMTVQYEKYNLPNGLTVILNVDKSDPIAAVALYYHVGSSREVPGKTGFAHLFEHMMFQRSENVGEDELFRNIQGAGGTLNGSTSQDRTNYYEVVPKNALEMALWMEADRMGYLTNTVTKKALVNQINVVQNEKRQSYDNAPYGFSQAITAKNLYPQGHPYSWTVIGEMEDLASASVEDVRAFHRKYYAPNNATLAISGDIEIDQVKSMIEKYFGEIPAGEKIEKREPMPFTLETTKRLYHEDNFANAPQLTMAFPTVQMFSKDSYALSFLGDLMANTKKAPLYKVLVEEKKLTSRVAARNSSQELAGNFTISVAANPGVNLTEIERSIFEALSRFEKEGFTEEDLMKIKAGYETRFYSNFSSVQGKSFRLAEYQMYAGDPEFYKKELEAIQAVTIEDVIAVYEKYIKGKNFLQTSFVPRGQTSLIAEGSVNAGIIEEDVTKAAEVRLDAIEEEQIIKTPSKIDRSVMPPLGTDPEVNIPSHWSASLDNGIKIYGISNDEMPLVEYSLVIEGGHLLDSMNKAGLANLVAAMLNEGTKNKTPEELEDAIGLLGASIRVSAGVEDITISVSSMSKNFEKTLALVEEILLQPRWDEKQFDIARTRIINNIRRNAANPSYLASSTLNRLMFGENILATDIEGTEKSVSAITMDDLKMYYDQYFSPLVSRFIIAGNVDKERVHTALSGLNEKWAAKQVAFPAIQIPAPPEKSQIYFVDVPGAKQSVISIGSPALPRTNPDYYAATVANYKLGGSFNGIFNLILREEKGYTYGARSNFSGARHYGTFIASSMVRTNSTLESLTIFKTEMEKYRESMPMEYIDFTKSSLLKGNALRFETLSSLTNMLYTMTAYNLPDDYIRQEESYVKNLTPDQVVELSKKYIDPSRMYYVVVGDAKTQFKELEKAGLGKPIMMIN